MRYSYTLHAEEKLTRSDIRKLGITKRRIEKVLNEPIAIDESENPVLIAIGSLTKSLSLCVAHKEIDEGIRIITFYPAEKGRYERKIL